MAFLLLALTTSMPRLGDIGNCDYVPSLHPVPALEGVFSDIKVSVTRIGSIK